MRVLLFGATGMVGQGVLRECVLDPEVTSVLCLVRRTSAARSQSDKVRELIVDSFFDLSALEPEFMDCDACFFCLGVSSFGMKEAEYRKVTYDLTLSVARTLLKANAGMTFCYVSGAGTDVRGRQMWARVKGETEDALLAMGFGGAYMFRPGGIVPLDGITSKTALYRIVYAGLKPLLPMLLSRFPQYITTTRQVGRAMLSVARHGYPKPILEATDIAAIHS